VSPSIVMRLYRARPLDPRHGSQITRIVRELSARAGLTYVPTVFVIPSLALNAFAVGGKGEAVIGVTEGLLRKLSMRELAGVLAHEISHIRNDDLLVMGIADIMSRALQLMSMAAIFVALYYLPGYIAGTTRMPWLAIILLYFAPALGNLLQLALSRTREFDADLDGAGLTGDPEGLASALLKLERNQGSMIDDLLPSGRRIPQPSLLRSHPVTEQRLQRLAEVSRHVHEPPIVVMEEPMVTLVGMGPGSMRPRFRLPAMLWY
jgi:heat shock protein HtpX